MVRTGLTPAGGHFRRVREARREAKAAQQPGATPYAGATECRREQQRTTKRQKQDGVKGRWRSSPSPCKLVHITYFHGLLIASLCRSRSIRHRGRVGRRRVASRAQHHPPYQIWPTRAAIAPWQPEAAAILCVPLLLLAVISFRHLPSMLRRHTMS